MASVASPVERGVPPIRAGKGHSFLLRRLHSLSGIVPIGAFLLEHFISNAFATNGPNAYGAQVKFLTGLPFVPVLEIVGIYIPLLYHSLYGFYIWFRGESNVSDYPWAGNFMYAAQRWTGAIAFAYNRLGPPYEWGGDGTDGLFDCSGLVQAAYTSVGITMPRTASGLFMKVSHTNPVRAFSAISRVIPVSMPTT